MLLILALAVAMFNGSGIDRVPDPGPAGSTEDLEGLRGCGPMRTGAPSSDCVRRLQRMLRARGAAIPETGNYQNMTAEAVQQFQKARGNGLAQTGAVDEATLRTLTELPGEGDEWDLRRECVSLSRENSGTGGAGSPGRCGATVRGRPDGDGGGLAGGYPVSVP